MEQLTTIKENQHTYKSKLAFQKFESMYCIEQLTTMKRINTHINQNWHFHSLGQYYYYATAPPITNSRYHIRLVNPFATEAYAWSDTD